VPEVTSLPSPPPPQPDAGKGALKPCPFCCSSNVHLMRIASGSHESHYVLCGDCDAQGPFYTRKAGPNSARDAIDPWNAVNRESK